MIAGDMSLLIDKKGHSMKRESHKGIVLESSKKQPFLGWLLFSFRAPVEAYAILPTDVAVAVARVV
jgi:hypothetical protein